MLQVSTEAGVVAQPPSARVAAAAAAAALADPVDAFPHSAAGAAVLRRLEQRRRRLNKNRTASCSRWVQLTEMRSMD